MLTIALSVILSIPLILANSRTTLLCYVFVFLALTVLTIFMKEINVADGHDDNLWEFLNELSSGRLNSMTRSFNTYQVNLFGYGNTLDTTENGYVNALFSEELIFVCIFFFASI